MKFKVYDFCEYVGEEDRYLKKGLRYCIEEVDEKDPKLTYKLIVGCGNYRWVSEKDLKPTSYKCIRIDCKNKVEAHKLVEEAIKRYHFENRAWTDEELKEIYVHYGRLLAKLSDKGLIPIFHCMNPEGVTLECYSHSGGSPFPIGNNARLYRKKLVSSTVSKNDVYNETVGKVVCLCRILGENIPDVIMRKNCE